MAQGWYGEKVRLVTLERERHFENLLSWIRDPDVTRWLAHPETPMTREMENGWFENAQRSSTDIIFAVETLDGRHLGVSALHQISHMHKFCISGSYIALPEDRSKGFGTEAALLRSHFAFEVLGMRSIQSGYLKGNIASQKMQEKLGATVIGTIPERFWKRGAYVDEVLTILTREAFWKKHGKRFCD